LVINHAESRSEKKITIITAYNATPSTGSTTYYHQQLRLLSRQFQEQNLTGIPNPRRQFILDLQAWIEFLLTDGQEIILSLDANEVYNPDVHTTAHSLSYHPGKLTTSDRHDGKLATFISTCQLILPLAIQHTNRPFPASHVHGRNQIDYILVSPSLLPTVISTGVLPQSSLFHGDHRPYFVDFTLKKLFGNPAYDIAPANTNPFVCEIHGLLRNILLTYGTYLIIIMSFPGWRPWSVRFKLTSGQLLIQKNMRH